MERWEERVRCETIDFYVLHFDLSLFSLFHDAAKKKENRQPKGGMGGRHAATLEHLECSQ